MGHGEIMRSDRIRLCVRLDADHAIGLGHGTRVAELLRQIKSPLDVHICGSGDPLDLLFDNDTITRHSLTQAASEEDKCADFLDYAQKIKADLLLIDQPDQTAATWASYHRSAFSVIAIDDYGGDVQADLVFNGTILENYHHYPLISGKSAISEKSAIFCGSDYALLNPVFGAVTWQKPQEKNLLIVIGGGARATQWALALTGAHSPFLQPIHGKVTLIVGAAFPEMAAARTACKKLDITLRQNIPQAQLAQLLAHHSIALITGGMIVYETLASGCPPIIFPQEENLIPEATWFAEHGMALSLGFEGGMDMKKVGNMIAAAYNFPTKSDKKKIDGKGMLRAAKEIDKFCATIQQDHQTS